MVPPRRQGSPQLQSAQALSWFLLGHFYTTRSSIAPLLRQPTGRTAGLDHDDPASSANGVAKTTVREGSKGPPTRLRITDDLAQRRSACLWQMKIVAVSYTWAWVKAEDGGKYSVRTFLDRYLIDSPSVGRHART